MMSHPRFVWDVRLPPRTDGQGNQEAYWEAASLWKEYHGSLPFKNSNQVPPNQQGIILISQLEGREKNMAKELSKEDLKEEEGSGYSLCGSTNQVEGKI